MPFGSALLANKPRQRMTSQGSVVRADLLLVGCPVMAFCWGDPQGQRRRLSPSSWASQHSGLSCKTRVTPFCRNLWGKRDREHPSVRDSKTRLSHLSPAMGGKDGPGGGPESVKTVNENSSFLLFTFPSIVLINHFFKKCLKINVFPQDVVN